MLLLCNRRRLRPKAPALAQRHSREVRQTTGTISANARTTVELAPVPAAIAGVKRRWLREGTKHKAGVYLLEVVVEGRTRAGADGGSHARPSLLTPSPAWHYGENSTRRSSFFHC